MKQPKNPDNSVDDLDRGIFFRSYDKREHQVASYTTNKSIMSSILLGQCDNAMHAKLEMTKDWENHKPELFFLLKAAQATCVGIQENFSMYVVARDALRSFHNYC